MKITPEQYRQVVQDIKELCDMLTVVANSAKEVKARTACNPQLWDNIRIAAEYLIHVLPVVTTAGNPFEAQEQSHHIH